MTEVKFTKADKGSGIVVTTEDVQESKMDQTLMNKDMFKIDETPNNNHLTECSTSYELQILLFYGHVSEA